MIDIFSTIAGIVGWYSVTLALITRGPYPPLQSQSGFVTSVISRCFSDHVAAASKLCRAASIWSISWEQHQWTSIHLNDYCRSKIYFACRQSSWKVGSFFLPLFLLKTKRSVENIQSGLDILEHYTAVMRISVMCTIWYATLRQVKPTTQISCAFRVIPLCSSKFLPILLVNNRNPNLNTKIITHTKF